MTNKTLKIFYGLIFLTSFFVSTVFTTYVPFLAERSMSRLEINLINAFFMLSVFLMEVPTGSYADSWGRKRCFLYSLLFEAVSFAVYYLSNSFLFFVLAEVLAAVAWAFASGSLEAWLVDSLKHHGFNGELTKVFYRESVFHQSGFILGGLAGAYVGARFNLALPWLLASVGSLFCFILATFLMKEEYFVRKKLNGFKQKSNQLLLIIKDSINYGIKVKKVFYLVSLNSGMMLGFQAFNMYWTLKFREHFSQNILGWIWMLISLAILFGSLSNRWCLGLKISKSMSLLLYVLICALGGLAAVFFYDNLFFLILFFIVHEFGRGGFKPIKRAFINENIPSDKRATIISFDSMIEKLGAVVGLLLSGLIAQNYSIKESWLFCSIIICLSSFICFKLNKEEEAFFRA